MKYQKFPGLIFFLLSLFLSANSVAFAAKNYSVNRSIKLPEESNQLELRIESVREVENKSGEFVQIGGWAFIKGMDAKNSVFYVVLKSDEKTYIFDTNPVKKPYVTKNFESLNLDLDDSGFIAQIPKKSINNGIYAIGVYVQKGKEKVYQQSGSYLTRIQYQIIGNPLSAQKKLTLPAETNDLTVALESVRLVSYPLGDFVEVKGWAHPTGEEPTGSQIYLAFFKGSEGQIYETFPVKKPYLTERYKNTGLNLDDAGFIALVPKEVLGEGVYTRIGILVQKDEKVHYQETDRIFTLKDKVLLEGYLASPQFVALPKATNELTVGIESFRDVKYGDQEYLFVSGFGFVTKKEPRNLKIYVTFENGKGRAIFNTYLVKKPYLTERYKNLQLDLSNSGFVALVPKSILKEGSYSSIGIGIEQDGKLYYMDAGRVFTRVEGNLIEGYIAHKVDVPEFTETNDLTLGIESIRDVKNAAGEFVWVSGFAFVNGESPQGNSLRIVFQTGNRQETYDTYPVKKPYITERYKVSGLNLDESGFVALVPKDLFSEDQATLIGIYIEKRNKAHFQNSGRSFLYSEGKLIEKK